MARQRTSPIWQMSKEDFAILIAQSKHYTEALSAFSLRNKGNNHKTIRARIKEEGLDATHFKLGAYEAARQALSKIERPVLDDILIEKSPFSRAMVKRLLLTSGRLPNKCALCEMPPEWQGKKLVLVLDHINGVSDDNRIENLRLLCPNCNSQQATFAGRNCKTHSLADFAKSKHPKTQNICSCGARVISASKTRCPDCGHKSRRKLERPALDIVRKQVEEIGYRATGRLYGLSDNAIRKWLK